MISADTSSLSNFLKRSGTSDADLIRRALLASELVLTPIVLAELYSSKMMTDTLKTILRDIPLLDLKEGFWERVGENRLVILQAGKKARLADSMIATCCLDHGVPLIAVDSDYRHFSEHFGLAVKTS